MDDKDFDDEYPEEPLEVVIDDDATIILEPDDELILEIS